MANELDEITGPVNEKGHDINVIDKQLPVKVGFGSLLFEICVWGICPVLVLISAPMIKSLIAESQPGTEILYLVLAFILSFLPGLIYLFKKINARNYFRQLQQKLQADASNIDNYLEQRVRILQNVAALVSKATELDKEVMTTVAALRGGGKNIERNAVASQIDGAFNRLFPQVEAYPELKAHAAIADAMQQNAYLQKEITAARTVYNDTVMQWNTDIYEWPVKMIVAARAGYTSRIPFTASAEVKQSANQVFF